METSDESQCFESTAFFEIMKKNSFFLVKIAQCNIMKLCGDLNVLAFSPVLLKVKSTRNVLTKKRSQTPCDLLEKGNPIERSETQNHSATEFLPLDSTQAGLPMEDYVFKRGFITL